jgi:hypothetical protein
MIEKIRDNSEVVAGKSRSVRIDERRLEAFARTLPAEAPEWWDGVSSDVHFFDGTEKSLMYLLLLDATNFCFWPSSFEVELKGRWYGKEDGYLALAAAYTRAFEEGVPLWDTSYLADVSLEDFTSVFRGRGEVPLLMKRWHNARDVGQGLLDRYGGSAVRLLEAAGYDAVRLAELLARDFRAYQDERIYDGSGFPVMKRAQLCVSDIIGAFRGEGPGALKNADRLTCFADYKLPQLFRSKGIFVYERLLDQKIRSGCLIEENSPEEVEIRLCTIAAVERLKRFTHGLTARELDWILWNESIREGAVTEPHHRTVTTAY